MATSLSLENDSSLDQGYIKVNGTTAATLTTSGITGNLTGDVTGSLTAGGSLTLATAQSASGTAVDFTGIPSWAKRITVMFGGVSTNGGDPIIVQIGSGSITSTGYASNGGAFNFASNTTGSSSTSGFCIHNNSSYQISGHMILTVISGNSWISSHVVLSGNCGAGGGISPSLSGSIDRVRITTTGGTNTFDAGTINISYEG